MPRPLRRAGPEADHLTRGTQRPSAALLGTACAVQVAAYASFFNLTPLFPEVGADLGMDAGALGALVGFGGIVALLAQVPAGNGGDRYGRRPFFAVGLLLALLGLLLRWQAYAPATLLLGQVAAGAALGIISTNAFALAAEGFTARRQPQAIGVVNVSVNIGQVVGYLIAGTLGALVGWRALSLNMALLPGCVLLVILFVPGLLPGPDRTHTRPGPLSVLQSLAHPQRLTMAALAALTLAVGQGACYLLPFAVQTDDGGPLLAAIVLVPYVIGSVIGAPLGSSLATGFGSRLVISGALLLGVFACVAAARSASSVAVLAVCNVAIGIAVNSTLPLVAANVVALRTGAPVGAGTAIGGLRVGQSLGPFIGPSLAGWMLARSGADAAWLAMAGCLVLGVALHLIMSQRT
jgi:MFS transporter, DHA1 family, chloramphenicol resistance protein